MRVWPGDPYPLGASWTGVGVNFALFSSHATRVDLCLFDSPDATKESHRIELTEHHDMVWHGFLPDARPNQLYGYRVHGPYEPSNGHRFNPYKVVMDPYARSVARTVRWADEMFGYRVGDPNGDLTLDTRDNAQYAPLAAVVDPAFTWGDDRRLRTPWHNSVIYEMHVRGFSKLHPDIPERLRGMYEALTTDLAIEHLTRLGITAVELMPVHHHARDRHLEERGLTNYWGYNSFGYFAPERRLAASRSPAGAVREFKRMVRALHAAGIEVILDVVYDGFTLNDLVSYNHKHNAANLEDNRDGENNNLSWNCGVEGPTGEPAILELRERQKRNLLATLMLSQGVPMISHGDEVGRTQYGNNNGYCQDNVLTWIDWDTSAEQQALLAFTAMVLMNAHHEEVPFTLPPLDPEQHWQRMIDTREPETPDTPFTPGARFPLHGQSVVVFKMTPPLHERRRVHAVGHAVAHDSVPA